jgi:uncharacterized protein (DUF169 family)
MNRYAEAAKSLSDSLNLSLPPVFLRLCNQIPEGVPSFDRTVAAGCVFWQEAARGPFATSAQDHALCSIGIYTHNLTPAPEIYRTDLTDTLKVMENLDYVRPEDVDRIPVLHRESRYVIYGPLSAAVEPPDAVIVFAQSRQGLIITEAVQQVEEGLPPALGRPACALIPQVLQSGRAGMSLGCCGARAYLDALTDDIALWALPGSQIDRYCERIAVLAAANRTLDRFHSIRKKEIEAGHLPSVRESLSRLEP